MKPRPFASSHDNNLAAWTSSIAIQRFSFLVFALGFSSSVCPVRRWLSGSSLNTFPYTCGATTYSAQISPLEMKESLIQTLSDSRKIYPSATQYRFFCFNLTETMTCFLGPILWLSHDGEWLAWLDWMLATISHLMCLSTSSISREKSRPSALIIKRKYM